MSKNRKLKKEYFEIKWKTDLAYRYSIGKLAVKNVRKFTFCESSQNVRKLTFPQVT